jgi:hypothetical protein
MRNTAVFASLSALVFGLTMACPLPALAAGYDGDWTVLVTTAQGNCDRTYSYEVSVAQGRILHTSYTSVTLNGTVSPQGAVMVSIRHFDDVATGRGHLAARTGGGAWRGTGKDGTCSGQWKAQRR